MSFRAHENLGDISGRKESQLSNFNQAEISEFLRNFSFAFFMRLFAGLPPKHRKFDDCIVLTNGYNN